MQHATHSAGKLPASFTSNSPKEQQLLAYISDFQRVFQELYPHRCPPTCTPAHWAVSQDYNRICSCMMHIGCVPHTQSGFV